MGSQVTLKATPREETGKGVARKLRAVGKLPAVVYGAGEDALSLTLDAHDATILFRSISVDNTIVNLEVEGQSVPFATLVREVQTHPFRPDILHVDFLRVQTGVEVELDVPLHLEGTPVGVKDDGGVLEQGIHELPVRCVPSAIPTAFVVDVSALGIGDSLHVSDVPVTGEVTILRDLDLTICSVQIPSALKADDEEEEEAEDVGEPEVIGAEAEEESEDEDGTTGEA
jgi:large subunit ribosomal protein L25